MATFTEAGNMNRKWFRMDDSLDATPGRWHLSVPMDSQGNEIESRIFTEGCPIERSGEVCRSEYAGDNFEWTGELTVSVQYEGVPLDFTFAAFDMLVLRPEVADLLETVAPGQFQRFPARIAGHEGKYEIINVLPLVDCVDEERTKAYRKWAYEDPSVDLPGKYFQSWGLHILAEKVAQIGPDINLWRAWNHEIMFFVSESVKDALEAKRITGVRFQELGPPKPEFD